MASDYLKLYEDYLREEKHASENTLSSYLRDLRQFSEHLAAQRVTDLRKVKTAAISDYVAWMGGKGKSAATVTRALASIKSFYAFLAERGEINYHDCFVEPLWNTTEYLWAMGDQTGIGHLQRYGGARLKLPYSTDGFCINIVPTFECVEMYYTHNGLPWDRDPETMHIDPYAYNAEKETVNLHVYKEPRFYASVGYDRGKYAINGEEFILKCRAGEMQGSVLDASKEYQSCTGYILKKWIHRQSAFNYDTKSWTYRKYAYPYIRLAELYLSYAEADFEYNGSLSDASLNYLNLVRRRSGLPDFKDSWALAGGIPTGDELRKVLHRERSIELLMEGMRYHDLRRWKEAGEAMSRRPKAWNLDGRTAADFYRVSTMKESGVRTFESPKTYWMAIPLSEININYNLVQNPGY